MIFILSSQIQIIPKLSQTCTNEVLRGNTIVNFCVHRQDASSITINQVVRFQRNRITNLFIGIELIQSSQINIQIYLPTISSFYLFGQTNQIKVLECLLNSSIVEQVEKAAAICTVCNIDIQASTIVFIASGQNISGLVYESLNQIVINQTFIQLRFTAYISAGLAFQVNYILAQFNLIATKIACNNFINSADNGYFVSYLQLQSIQQINISQVYLCTNIISRFGQNVINICIWY
ncbi:Hypothetical_protein [Hexamita inflata]|uniref:Hypothetical_protein n=1 Tax=Hexamita inflata TaxID=28002 RepID=A0AA86QAB4_9EUKA|nr:Hypothetical protein HINF_LOCUS43114 [Hexamita inflata]